VTQGNPHWQRAQPKAQTKQQQEGRQRRGVRDGFDDEWVGKDVEVEQVKGVIRGKIIDVSRYWLKMVADGQTLYVNKAYVVSIKPAEMKDGQGGGNAGAGQSARQ
jgi:hypothetical protein